ncbi:MAG: nucleotidyl transferase AbiEii/AbiGii toxin family protein [Paludibacter sp.]|jgi:predicted nucleotidyltransferase component of viral defense system|nr:nucleotidyl transferase AbiEii/AbiGii toxin family protein [Paludibacter sp.]
MNEKNTYKKQVELLLKIIPTLQGIDNFAVHGGTAINLYLLNLPRYSVDIDVTYTPINSREESFAEIHNNLTIIKERVKTSVPNVIVTEKPNKIYCNQRGIMVKVEVNGTKRGLIEPSETKTLCSKAQTEFEISNKAKIVSFSQLYGGKISAALDRQHPRDLFDIQLMFRQINNDFSKIRKGFFYSLLGGDRPIVETLAPNRTDQSETLVKQFSGMTEIPFPYADFEETREKLIDFINSNLTDSDKEFLPDFESANFSTKYEEYKYFLQFPSVQWKVQNINKLKIESPVKHRQSIEKLETYLSLL